MARVEVELDPAETAIAESGAFMMMDDGIEMQTIFGDGTLETLPDGGQGGRPRLIRERAPRGDDGAISEPPGGCDAELQLQHQPVELRECRRRGRVLWHRETHPLDASTTGLFAWRLRA